MNQKTTSFFKNKPKYALTQAEKSTHALSSGQNAVSVLSQFTI